MQHWGSQYELPDSNHKSATYFLNEPRWTIYHLNTLPLTLLYCSFFIYKIAKYCMYPHNNKTHIEFPLREDHNTSCENITKSRLRTRLNIELGDLVFLADFYNEPWLFCSFIQLITIFVLICSYSHPPLSPL